MRATSQKTPGQSIAGRLRGLIAGYSPLPGAPDEFIGRDGRLNAHWLRFLDALAELAPEDMERRFASADRHIRDTGVSYRAYGEANERSWPLSHVPLLIGEEEWRGIARGVTQRADLLEHTLADIYGEGRLVADGILPAAAITGSPDFLHPLKGIKPPGGRFLHLYAADLGRGPDGRWWVLGDRTQIPTGAGYALANRLVLSRAFPALYRDMNVERLAPFFQGFRSGLAAVAQRADPRICLLTPGPQSETYFEQAYLARYLGFLLVEGGDLTMRDGHVHVRTIAGLKRADVLWRRIDSDFADPLELNAQSQLGVPGLVEALRANGVVVANALGSGVLETPVMMSFMSSISRHSRGEELLLPNIATWWCGQQSARGEVLANIDRLTVRGAFGNSVLGRPGEQPFTAGALSAGDKALLISAINARGVDFVGQEDVGLSTTPVWSQGRLTPRPFVLRVYAAATPEGWMVMPGGFARISDRADARAVSMGEGVRSADVWVIADKPVAATTLLPTDDNIRIRRIMGNLPSRAADNLFWLGRYLERAEATLRLIRCFVGRLLDSDAQAQAETLDKLKGLLGAWGAAPFKTATTMPSMRLTAVSLYSAGEYGSALSLVRAAQRAASVIRERLSPDTWRLIDMLQSGLDADAGAPVSETDAIETANRALRALSAISGLAQENMNQVAGWRFLEAGRRIERGVTACRMARNFARASSPAEDLDVLLDLVDSQITYRSRYLMGVALRPVRDLVILDPFNPRSLAFQVEQLRQHLDNLPVLNDDGMPEEPRRIIVKLAAELAVAEARDVNTGAILAYEQRLTAFAEAVAARYFLQGPNAAREDKMSGLA